MNSAIISAKSKIVLPVYWICALLCILPHASAESQSRRISPRLHVTLFDESVITYSDLQGKVTVIDFWGTWCKPCLAEIPDYQAFYRDYKDKGVIFVALAVDSGKAEKVREASQRLKLGYPVGAPSKEELRVIGKIRAYPTTWVVGPSGEIVKEFLGVVPGKQKAIREIVDSLLNRRGDVPQSPDP
jgi:cytochrome c biogenesis protein CcmG/thiol:disulfide interchange protein DsbE